MLDVTSHFLSLFAKYFFIYIYFLLVGRSLSLSLNYITKTKEEYILSTKPTIFYPIIGLAIVGNLLILLNFFLPLKSLFVYVILAIVLIPNLLDIKRFDIKRLNLDRIFIYLIIPTILILSSSDISFHFDAGYYHLNHQNWLRESNLVVGMVNIFWPFGISSIYEYLSSILWFNDSLIYLHFLSLIFIHFLLSFMYFHIFGKKNSFLKYSMILVMVFAFLDNFGVNGGRNGFIYIQGITKQDTSVAILFMIITLLIFNCILEKKVSKADFFYIGLLTFFIYEIKISGVVIFILYFYMIYYLLNRKIYNFKEMIKTNSLVIFFGLVWIVKSYITSGCLVFPVSITCINKFDWYIHESTKEIQTYTANTSFAFMEYFVNPDLGFNDWFNNFFKGENISTFSEFYSAVYLNYLLSLGSVIIFVLIFFKIRKQNFSFVKIVISFILINYLYLLFFGPIPRYSMGISITSIAVLGFFIEKEKFNINNKLKLSFFILTILLIPRFNSYTTFINIDNLYLVDPRVEVMYEEIIIEDNWVTPSSGGRCWVNIDCTLNEDPVFVNTTNFFKVAREK